jgi:hypothetical protein
LDDDEKVLYRHFIKEKRKEFKIFDSKKVLAINSNIAEYLNTFDNRNFKKANDYYEEPRKKKFKIDESKSQRWIQHSFIDAADLFEQNENIDLVDYSEADLFHHVWLFVYNCFKSSQVKAKLGERGSRSSALGRNSERVLESTKRRERKASGAKVNVLFKSGVRKVGCAEVGKDDVLVVDDKYIDDDLIKLPKALRHMLRELVNINPQKINELYTVGFLMMGKC